MDNEAYMRFEIALQRESTLTHASMRGKVGRGNRGIREREDLSSMRARDARARESIFAGVSDEEACNSGEVVGARCKVASVPVRDGPLSLAEELVECEAPFIERRYIN